MARVEIGDIDFPRHQEYKLAKISRELFRLMMNNPKYDYATLEEMFAFEEMENYDPAEVCMAVDELTKKEKYNNLLLEIKKPYGKVYAVNKRRIPEMIFTYQPWGFHEMTGM
ncbi:MAG: hypothetical protein IKS03_04385 [Ruminococcus sp.]|nr:hypothetical protein [Ruminococcus sp.]